MRQALTLVALAFTSLVVSGCERPEDPMLKILESTASQTRVDDLSRTMDYVFSERQFDQTEFNNSVSIGLNRWSNYSDDQFDAVNWKLDPTLESVTDKFADAVPTIGKMDGSTFLASDAEFLQSVVWMDQVVSRVKNRGVPSQHELLRLMADDYQVEGDEENPFENVIKNLNPDVTDATKLSQAVQIFDWIVRNVQLDATPTYTEDEIEEQRLAEGDTLPASGLVSAGAKRSAWHLLIFARGDYVEKSKLFMMMCHQIDLPTVMLATGENAKPWAVGVLVGEEYYLFDMRLGLPIPGKDDTNIATLSEVVADATLLSKLDLSVKESLADDTKYWATESDLEKLTGLVYWNPESASRRMAVLENSLTGDQRLRLVQQADETIAKLPKLDNVEYKPWDISLQTAQYRKVLGESLPKAVSDDALADRLGWYFPEEGYIMAFPNYRTGRTRFLKGKFELAKEVRSRDSIESFAMLMYEDEIIDGLESNLDLQVMIGIRKAGQTPAEWEQDISTRQAQMRLVRRDAGLFMCQAHFDNGSLSTTANWVPKLLAEQDVERWEPALSYLNARALEARHQYDEAIEELKSEGPQQHGNLIRARLIKQQIETHYTKKSGE